MKLMKVFYFLVLILSGFNFVYAQKTTDEKIKIWESKSDSAVVLFNEGKYKQAIPVAIEALNYSKNEFEIPNPFYTVSLNNLLLLYEVTKDYNQAIPLYKEIITDTEKNSGKNSEHYILVINKLAQLYQTIGEYDNSLPLYIESSELTKKNKGKDSQAYGISLSNLANLYKLKGEYDKALPLLTEDLKIIENTVGKDQPEYGLLLNSIAETYIFKADYDKALDLFLKSILNIEKTLGKEHPFYGVVINNLAYLYELKGEYDKALPLYLEALRNTEKALGKDHPEYGRSLNNLANLYKKTGEYDKALPLLLEALENTEKTLGKNHPDYGTSLDNLANLYESMGDYNQALPLYLLAVENTKKTLGKNHPDYITRLNNLANLYETLGEYDKALPLFIETLELTERTLGKDHPDYSISLNNLANIYGSIGAFDKAMPLFQEALENTEKTLGKNHPDYGIRLNNIANLYKEMGEYEKALSFAVPALENTEKTLGKNHPEYASRLNNLAGLYKQTGDYDRAKELYLDALASVEKTLGKEHPDYSALLNNLGNLYVSVGDFEKALPLFLEAKQNIEKSLGKEHFKYGISLINLANLYRSTNFPDKALLLYQESLENLIVQINQVFSFTSEKEKENFVHTNETSFQTFQSFFLEYYNQNPEVAATAYDLELLTKGLILNSEIDLRKRIESIHNDDLSRLYDQFSRNKNLLAAEYGKPIANRRTDLKELENQTDNLESEINRQTNLIAEAKSIFYKSWKDVRNNLGRNETAIEFSTFRYKNKNKWSDSIVYVAMVLRKKDLQPILIPLFEQKELDKLIENSGGKSVLISQLYGENEEGEINQNAQKLYDLIWNPIEKYVKEAKKIYFAPSGKLHQIAFSAIRLPDGTYLSDKYNLQQLNSTAEISGSKSDKEINNMVLFGGIDYDVSYNELAKKSKERKKSLSIEKQSVPDDLMRGGKSWEYLPGTLTEINEIEQLAKKSKIRSILFTESDAGEENYKTLNGEQSPDILHIATHGFFFPDLKKEREVNMNEVNTNQRLVFRFSDNPLNRAGLLFSGANNFWKGIKPLEKTEDGILTAYEAGNVYLKNTILTVLSACETGLGEIRGSEGVYGLQRSFKAAGSKYLLMSLWLLPDKETAEFMSFFYKKLFHSNDIEKSFGKTQKMMRTKYRKEPAKWAAFVLVR